VSILQQGNLQTVIRKIITAIFRESMMWLEWILMSLPGRLGLLIRAKYWCIKLKCKHIFYIAQYCTITGHENIFIGNYFNLMDHCRLYAHNGGKIIIGDHVSMNSNVIIGAADQGDIRIGNDVLIGPNVVLRASNHRFDRKELPINKQGHSGGTIIIEDDVWIGANTTILPNVRIGRGAIIGAGTVVNKDILAYSLATGVPAVMTIQQYRS